MSSSEKDLLQDSLGEFTEGLHALVPLRHFTEYHDEDKIRKAAQQESNKVLKSFIWKAEALIDLKVKVDLLKELCLELEKLIEEHLKKNQECRAKAESFLKKRTDDLCEDFKDTYEAKLLLSPDMNLESAEELLENGKLLALCYFENHSNFGNIDLYEEQTSKLREKLEVMCKEMLENHGHFLESKAKKSLEDVKKIVRSMSGEIQRDISTLDDVVSGNLRKAKLVKDYLFETGNAMNKNIPQLQEGLCETLEGVINYLEEAKENVYLSLEVGIGWAGRLDQPLKTFFVETESSTATPTDLQNGGTSHQIIQKSEIAASQEPDESDLVGTNVDIHVGINLSLGKCAQPVEVGTHSKSGPKRNENIPNHGLEMEAMEDLQKAPDVISSSLTSNQIQQNDQETTHEENETADSDLNLRFPGEDENLLRAIWERQSVTSIKSILDEGANVNVKSSSYDGVNAAHVVIALHGLKHMTSKEACVILNIMLVASGFNLMNEGDQNGMTPLLLATGFDSLDEELLNWFFKNGADFNAALNDDVGYSVLLRAISFRHDAKIIRKIIEFGGNQRKKGKVAVEK